MKPRPTPPRNGPQKPSAAPQASQRVTSGTHTSPEARTRGRGALRPQVRVIGTPAEVAAIISRISHVIDVAGKSRQVPRRDEHGRVSVYLEIAPEGDR